MRKLQIYSKGSNRVIEILVRLLHRSTAIANFSNLHPLSTGLNCDYRRKAEVDILSESFTVVVCTYAGSPKKRCFHAVYELSHS